MHFIFSTRGIKHDVDRLINELSTRYLPFKPYNPNTKQLQDMLIQMRVCPIQLWDISFPREHRDAVINTLLAGGKGIPIRDSRGWRLKLLDKSIKVMQKLLGLRPLGEYKTDQTLPMKQPENVEVIAIGEKDDYFITEKGEHVDYEHKTPLSFEGI